MLRRAIESHEAELEGLLALSSQQLDAYWRELCGTERPRRIYAGLLVGVLAYRLQEKALGGLKPATRRLLRQVAGNPSERRALDALTKPRLKAGAVLLREWHGLRFIRSSRLDLHFALARLRHSAALLRLLHRTTPQAPFSTYDRHTFRVLGQVEFRSACYTLIGVTGGAGITTL
jgi:hypothetical protein